jgi:hypothetical protein
VWAYPKVFAETFCASTIEAMTAGCKIVTSALGALPVTTNGLAHLIPVDGDWHSYQD